MSKGIYVYCEQRDGEIKNVSYELLGAANALKASNGQEITAILCGYGIRDKAQSLIEYGADRVIVADYECLAHYITEPYAQVVAYVIKEYDPNILLYPATSIGRDLAPRISARVNTGLTADCTKLESDEEGNLFMTRPAFGGNLFATIICPDHRPQMSTVRPGVMQKLTPDAGRKGEIISVDVPFDTGLFSVELLEEVRDVVENDNIEDAKVLVSVGRGMKKYKNLAAELAALLKGTVSCSRAVVDEGILPQSKQVGQTGKTVRPELYMALGISGAVQHLAGMENSDYVVAVNKDKGANIMSVAQTGVCCDAKAFCEALIKEIKARKAQ